MLTLRLPCLPTVAGRAKGDITPQVTTLQPLATSHFSPLTSHESPLSSPPPVTSLPAGLLAGHESSEPRRVAEIPIPPGPVTD